MATKDLFEPFERLVLDGIRVTAEVCSAQQVPPHEFEAAICGALIADAVLILTTRHTAEHVLALIQNAALAAMQRQDCAGSA